MSKFIKKALSIFLATCTALPGTICYAGKNQKRKARPPCSESAVMDPKETELQVLRAEIEDLIGSSPDREKLALSESLKSKCINIENAEQLGKLFEDFFVNFIETDGSAASQREGTILFLSIVKLFERSAVPPRDQNLYRSIAFLALDMCAINNRIIYNKWYDLLLRKYMPPAFNRIKKDFDRKESEKWHRDLHIVATDKHRFDLVIVRMGRWLIRQIDEDSLTLLINGISERLSPVMSAQSRAKSALELLEVAQSTDLISYARQAFTEYRDELNKAHAPSTQLQQNMEKIQDIFDSLEAPVVSAQNAFNSLKTAQEKIIAMLSAISPESITDAERACQPLFEFNKPSTDSCTLMVQNMIGSTITCFADALKWAQEYWRFVIPCMEESNKRIDALTETFSDENLAAAIKAQKDYEQALSEHKPTSMIIELGLSQHHSVTAKMVEDFENAKAHCKRNQERITDLQKQQEALKAMAELKSKQEQQTADWKKAVAAAAAERELKAKEEKQRTEVPERKELPEVVFYHAPERTNPLDFLEKNPGYKAVWNDWYDRVREDRVEGAKKMKKNGDVNIFENETGSPLPIYMENGTPVIWEYKGGEEARNTEEGLRIVYYKELGTNQIVVLYVGEPFGEVAHGKPWETLHITKSWIKRPIGKF